MQLATPEQIRTALVDYLDAHHAACDKGMDCKEAVMLAAWLCHSAGLRSDDLRDFTEEMRYYEVTCQKCSHKRN